MALNRRGCRWVIFVATALLALGAFLVYRYVSSRVDFRPVLSPAGEASLDLPSGFASGVFASGLNQPRFIAFSPDGVLFVAERGNNRIVYLPDTDGDGQADDIRLFAGDLDQPHSIAYHQGAWYTGVPTGVIRLEDTDGDGLADKRKAVVIGIPGTGQHRTRTVAFFPDGRMVLSVGSSCNVCREQDPRRAAILVYGSSDGEDEQVFASGLRNAVGLAVHPESGELWATNNARDLMGDDIPPDTVHIVRQGVDYGWPGCHGGSVPDPDFGGAQACQGVAQPLAQLQAHSAPLGLVFYTGTSFPAEYQGDLFVAYHGSWNRSEPTGYKIVHLPISNGELERPVEDFATGWLDEESGAASGRPVGLAVGPDGTLYVSDDKGGLIYRIIYQG